MVCSLSEHFSLFDWFYISCSGSGGPGQWVSTFAGVLRTKVYRILSSSATSNKQFFKQITYRF